MLLSHNKKINDDLNWLTVVIPTKGRDTLERCLESLMPKHQGDWGIDVVVVVDHYFVKAGQMGHFLDLEKKYGISVVFYDAHYSDWGYPQIEYVYKNRTSNGLYLMNIGDDDVMIEGAIPEIIAVLQDYPLQPFMFQAWMHPSAHRGNEEPMLLWNDESRDIKRKSVTGQNLIVPNIPQFMGHMTDDFVFIKDTIKLWKGNVKWIPKPIVNCF